jgi:hypothetical protein
MEVMTRPSHQPFAEGQLGIPIGASGSIHLPSLALGCDPAGCGGTRSPYLGPAEEAADCLLV